MSSVAEQPLHRALGLTDGELDRIRELMGRDPNDLELAIFSLLWSEHCGYKHSALLLKRFPTEGPGVLQGPGENAGAVDVGGGEAVVFKVESHNHPSAVEPFQGAATGVGGIIRDVVAMGARPIALLDGLRFGAPDWSFWRAAGGIGHYGNCLAADEQIVLRNGGRTQQASIGNVVEERGPGTRSDEWTAPPAKPFDVLSLDRHSGAAAWKPVARIFKRKADYLIRIEAVLGRTLTVSGDHPVLLWEDGRLIERTASEVAPGDRIPLIASLPCVPAPNAVDLIAELDEPSIVMLPTSWRPSTELRHALKRLIPRADQRHYWLSRRELPTWVFLELETLTGTERRDLRLRLEGPRSTPVPALFPVDSDTARLIGYYLSEGCSSRSGSTIKLIWTFGQGERDTHYVHDVRTILDRLGIRHSVELRQSTVAITVSSRLLGRVLVDVLGCGHSAAEKRIPSILFQGPRELQVEVLKGIFRGDGSVTLRERGSSVRISHSTVSRKLHEQLILLLQSGGIFPYCYRRRAGGSSLRGRRIESRPAYQLEFSNHDAVSKSAEWFLEPEAATILAAISGTRNSPFGRRRATLHGGIATIPIRHVRRIEGAAPVYDLEVPGTHVFATSHGILTHNCVGIPTVGGDTFFDPAYAANPLVNAMCVGIVPKERLTRARATGPGNLVVLFGATTGRDGIGGASVLASQELSDEDEDKRPSVQIGDPFTGKKLLEASLELVERGLVTSLQDLGAAGLASSLAEMASRGGAGVDVHLDRVPLREHGMGPVEIMISESQERMVAVVAPRRLTEVEAVVAKWELAFAAIGEVTGTGELRCFHGGEAVAAVPAAFLTDECPRYVVEPSPRVLDAPVARRPAAATTGELLALLASPNVASRAPIYTRFDHLVGSRTVRRPGLDAAVVRLRPSLRGLAVSLDASGRIARLDPRAGGALAVLEAARNVACAGGRPLALTDCLNFGNPEKPEIAWELAEVIEGMSLAAEALRIPVVSGNVSLYNETDGRAIYPTPAVGCVGLVEDVRRSPRSWRAGDAIFVAGDPRLALDGSEYQALLLGGPAGRPPRPDLPAETALIAFLWRSGPLLSAAHDAAEGGLAVAFAELALFSGVGADVDIGRDVLDWFGEGGGQVVLACRPEDVPRLETGVPLRRVGTAGGSRLLGVPLEELRAAYDGGLA